MIKIRLKLFVVLCLLLPVQQAFSDSPIAVGFWYNYQYEMQPSDNTNGQIGNEALILYLDHQAEQSPWRFSAEYRLGPGSFTDIDNNSSGDNAALHKAWMAYAFSEHNEIKIGKSQVPFGWKTLNFWPGDMLLGGYGDQMDVGINYQHRVDDTLALAFAYYHADDWGAESTDTLDDNRHWGDSASYRKVQTLVADMQWQFTANQKLGLSVQSGRLQDLNGSLQTNADYQDATGEHHAAVIYYSIAPIESTLIKAQLLSVQRELPDSMALAKVENQRAAVTASYDLNRWQFYLDVTAARSSTVGNVNSATVTALAPGAKYNYGNGWFYLEYLNQNGYIDRHGDVGKGDYSAWYLTGDYYF